MCNFLLNYLRSWDSNQIIFILFAETDFASPLMNLRPEPLHPLRVPLPQGPRNEQDPDVQDVQDDN